MKLKLFYNFSDTSDWQGTETIIVGYQNTLSILNSIKSFPNKKKMILFLICFKNPDGFKSSLGMVVLTIFVELCHHQ